MNKNVRIATRRSRLALWQAEHVRSRLQGIYPDLNVELIPITTTGDRIIDRPLAKIGGKGLFIKELEQALFDQRADFAVHSMKDVPVETPQGLHIPVIMAREDPRDAILVNGNKPLSKLPADAIIGTSSLRRKSQLLQLRRDINVVDLRGNVTTRIEKLRAGDFDAIILAAAGLRRLGFAEQITDLFAPSEMIPAVGQGAIGIECRDQDEGIENLLMPLNDAATSHCVSAERAMSLTLNGGCDIPLAAHATIMNEEISLSGLVASIDGERIVRADVNGAVSDAQKLGRELGRTLLERGAGEILAEITQG